YTTALGTGALTLNGVGAGGNLRASGGVGPNVLANALVLAGDGTLNSGAGTSSLTINGNGTINGANVQRSVTVTGAPSQFVFFNINGASEFGNIVTVNTALAATPGVQQNHGFVAGQVVVISGCPIGG